MRATLQSLRSRPVARFRVDPFLELNETEDIQFIWRQLNSKESHLKLIGAVAVDMNRICLIETPKALGDPAATEEPPAILTLKITGRIIRLSVPLMAAVSIVRTIPYPSP